MDPALAQLKDAQGRFFAQDDSPEASPVERGQKALRYFLPLYQKRQKCHTAVRLAIVEMTGFAYLQAGEPQKAALCFAESHNPYQEGMAYLIANDLDKTHTAWTRLIEDHPFHWCLTIWGCIQADLDTYPSFFQIRNHLEGSIGQFFRYQRADLAEQLIAYADVMAHINLETYKYIGRALLNLNDNHDATINRAEKFLLRNQKSLPNDPEVYYHLAQIKYAKGAVDDALVLCSQCLSINYAYTPAIALQTLIQQTP
jgi:tetratricopeptide (TPR) repeat protein